MTAKQCVLDRHPESYTIEIGTNKDNMYEKIIDIINIIPNVDADMR